MRFNCDSFWEKLDQSALPIVREKTKWHKWFAWYPVRVIQGDCRWLEVVERKIEYDCWMYDVIEHKEYRAIKNEQT